MALSHDIVTQFAKLVTPDKKTSAGTTTYGKVEVDSNGNKYVRIDGSDQLTPLDQQPSADLASSVMINDGDRVSVLIKNHTATVTGNLSTDGRAARTGDVEAAISKQISNIDTLIAESVQAKTAYLEGLISDKANVGDLSVVSADIRKLEAKDVEITGKLDAASASINNLDTNKLDAAVADVTF